MSVEPTSKHTACIVLLFMAVIGFDVHEDLYHIRIAPLDRALDRFRQLMGCNHRHVRSHKHMQIGVHLALRAARADSVGAPHTRNRHGRRPKIVLGNARMI